MTPEQFTYWLQGYLEVENPKQLGIKETKIIKDHLKTVFKKVTPERDKTDYSYQNRNNTKIC